MELGDATRERDISANVRRTSPQRRAMLTFCRGVPLLLARTGARPLRRRQRTHLTTTPTLGTGPPPSAGNATSSSFAEEPPQTTPPPTAVPAAEPAPPHCDHKKTGWVRRTWDRWWAEIADSTGLRELDEYKKEVQRREAAQERATAARSEALAAHDRAVQERGQAQAELSKTLQHRENWMSDDLANFTALRARVAASSGGTARVPEGRASAVSRRARLSREVVGRQR